MLRECEQQLTWDVRLTCYRREVLRSGQGGYTKAVDLWSLGCVTAVLLTGDSPFRDLEAPNNPAQLPQDNDLGKLEADLDWHNIGARARDFVRRLLVLDETKRMGVKSALRHSWFTNRAHKREFEALYKRSIKDWKPRAHQGPLIVDLCNLIETRNPNPNPVLAVDSCDSHAGQKSQISHQSSTFSEDLSQDPLLFGDVTVHGRQVSPTLSDPELPAHNRPRNTSICQEDETPLQSLPEREPRGMESDVLNIPGRHEPGRNIQDEYAREPILNGYSFPLEKDSYSAPTKKRTRDIWNMLDDDEVYEEVSNAVTGKRQQMIYGSNVLVDVQL